jgi:hypothetical protein
MHYAPNPSRKPNPKTDSQNHRIPNILPMLPQKAPQDSLLRFTPRGSPSRPDRVLHGFQSFRASANPQEHLNSALHLGPVEGSMNTIEASFERSN